MNIFFVYDTTYCKADEDDPKDAIMYFFPSQTSDSQHYLLCCQLAGVAKFLKTTFSNPSVIGLDQGKFAFMWSGKYLLVLGANFNVQTSVLHDQLLFLCGIFCFYHGSIDNVMNECKNNRDECVAKLELAWSRYITLSQRFGNILQISLSALLINSYKKSSGVINTASQLLHMCQRSSAVVAGAIFYNSRMICTQFMPHLTNYLSLMSNSNAAAPVGNAIHFIKNLPPDVELKYVYLSSKCIANILKYNHTSVGSRIRMKSTAKIQLRSCSSLPQGGAVGSGSEGDVDSGNCSEITRCNKNEALLKKSRHHHPCLKSCKHKKSSSLPCCSGHSKLFTLNLLHSKNRSSLKLIQDTSPNDAKLRKVDTDDSGFHPMIESTKHCIPRPDSNFKAVNVLCQSHADLLASSFAFQTKMKHSNLTSSSDSEYRCPLCSSYQSFISFNKLSLKQWNSELSISDSKHDTVDICLMLKCCDSPSMRRLETSKLQILKCRASGNFGNRFHRSRSQSASRKPSNDVLGESEIKITGAVSKLRNIQSNSGEKSENLESNELQKHVLYVQRYGGITLLLLLNKAYDEKVINYLWNAGFTVLRDLEFDSEKEHTEKISAFIDPSFYILLYNHVEKLLKEYPRFPPLLLTEKYAKESIQDIQQHFLQDPYFKMIRLLSTNQGIFAFQSRQHCGFYIQPEMNSRKLESLHNLSAKATKRLQKHFKITL